MRNYLTRTLGLTTAALLLAASAQAQGKGNAKDKGEHHFAKHRAAEIRRNGDAIYRDSNRDVYGRDVYRRDVYNRDVYNRDVYNRDVYNRDVYNRDDYDRDIYRAGRRVPPGLAKKPGQMPPGQYKKRYGTYEGASILGEVMRRRGYDVLRIVPAGTSRYVYYRPDDGREQRAIVRYGTDQLQFTNVPSAIVQTVLARLY